MTRPAWAETVKVLTAGAFKQVVVALVPSFEAARPGDHIVVDNDTVGALVRRVDGRETFDLLVLSPAAIEELTGRGRLVPGSRIDLARVGIGVAVKAGAPVPDIGTAASFTKTLLAAPSIAYLDPAAGGSSGIYVAQMLGRLGIAEAVAPKTVLVPGGLVAQQVANGTAALGIHQISELLPVPGITYVGPLPAELQSYTAYAGAVASKAADPAAASAFLVFLAGSEGIRVMHEKGMEPAGR
ncbi:MAG TPA: substrate-binding domain-containing protein [Stellaceae bacterium]|nr:substrate-binding domain-containing protein [Stellaceae bacterium]